MLQFVLNEGKVGSPFFVVFVYSLRPRDQQIRRKIKTLCIYCRWAAARSSKILRAKWKVERRDHPEACGWHYSKIECKRHGKLCHGVGNLIRRPPALQALQGQSATRRRAGWIARVTTFQNHAASNRYAIAASTLPPAASNARMHRSLS